MAAEKSTDSLPDLSKKSDKPGELPGLTPSDIQDTHGALDAHLKALTGGSDEKSPEDKAPEDKAPEDRASEEKAPEDKAPEDKAPEETVEDGELEDKAPEEKAPEDKAPEDKATEEKAPEDKATTKGDEFDKIELPPYTKPKSVEAFAQVKTIARQKISEAQKKVEDLTVEVSELRKKAESAKTVSPEVEKELKELREFRQRMDVQADPTFKQWDEKISQNEALIYGKLREANVGEEIIKQIEKLGGPANVDWKSIAGKLPDRTFRYIEGKLFESESLADQKKSAIEKAQANATEFLKTREQELAGQAGQLRKQVESEVARMLPEVKWLAEKPVPKDASDADRKAIEQHNLLVKEGKQDIAECLQDDSPATRALLILGFVQLRQVRAELTALKTSSKATEERLQKELDEKTKRLERIKNTSGPRLRSGGGTGGDKDKNGGAAPKAGSDLNTPSGDVLDRHLREAQLASEQ